VRPSLPFFAGEARGRGSRDYVVRANGAPIHIEHGTTDAGTMDQAFVQQVYEPSAAAEAAVRALGRPPVVLDCGANIGMFSVWASRRWPGCRTIAVEPLPRNVELLERNLALAPRPRGRRGPAPPPPPPPTAKSPSAAARSPTGECSTTATRRLTA
jgi:hypothetical protein